MSEGRVYPSGMDSAPPRPRFGLSPLCVRCGGPLLYIRQDRAGGVLEHRYDCGRCGQRHAAWSYEWEPHPLRKAEPPATE